MHVARKPRPANENYHYVFCDLDEGISLALVSLFKVDCCEQYNDYCASHDLKSFAHWQLKSEKLVIQDLSSRYSNEFWDQPFCEEVLL